MNGRKRCFGCAHYRKIIGGELGCNFYFDTGKLRNCSPEDCRQKETDQKKLKEFERRSKEEFS